MILAINRNAAQQSVHLTLGILRKSQAVSYALSFFWLDGFAVPAPAQVTQTVGCFAEKQNAIAMQKTVLHWRSADTITLMQNKLQVVFKIEISSAK